MYIFVVIIAIHRCRNKEHVKHIELAVLHYLLRVLRVCRLYDYYISPLILVFIWLTIIIYLLSHYREVSPIDFQIPSLL